MASRTPRRRRSSSAASSQDIEEAHSAFGLIDVHAGGSELDEVEQEVAPELARRLRLQARHLCVSAATLLTLHGVWWLRERVGATMSCSAVCCWAACRGRCRRSGASWGMSSNTLRYTLSLQSSIRPRAGRANQRELVGLLIMSRLRWLIAQRCSGIAASTPLFSTLLNYRHALQDEGKDWSDAAGIQVLAEQIAPTIRWCCRSTIWAKDSHW